jgi:hypothetical protein
MKGLGTATGLMTLSLLLATPASADQTSADQAAADPAAPAAEGQADPLFTQPYIDKDEWRDAPVRHRYVHGGFKGTDARFSFYLPEKAQYQGRFFQHITPVPDDENLAQKSPTGEENKIGFSIASGAYFVETNGGGRNQVGMPGKPNDATIAAYRANAAAARYSRVVAQQMYGGKRPYGYAFGGSGGGFRTVGSIENTTGVWDGVVPYVLGSPMAPPNMFSVRMRAMRVLNDKFPQILDAVEPGGSGNPYAGLTPDQASVLREVTAMGFPTPSWFGWRTMGIHGFAALYGGMLMADPSYFNDFWTKPGYLGHDDPKAFEGYRLQYDAKVATPITAQEAATLNLDTRITNGAANVDNAFAALAGEAARRIVAFRLSNAPPAIYFVGGDLIVGSGEAAKQRLTISRIVGDVVVLGVVDDAVATKIRAGDSVRVDNSNFLAAETYHWHQVPPADAGYPEWDQFRKPDGTPLYPQRAFLLGPLFTAATTGKPMGQPPMTGNPGQDDPGRKSMGSRSDAVAGRLVPPAGRGQSGRGHGQQFPHLVHRSCAARRQRQPRRSDPDRQLSGCAPAGTARPVGLGGEGCRTARQHRLSHRQGADHHPRRRIGAQGHPARRRSDIQWRRKNSGESRNACPLHRDDRGPARRGQNRFGGMGFRR